jgi:ABC-type uncharacterized transport system involved in gliding motility auxiliary subunit
MAKIHARHRISLITAFVLLAVLFLAVNIVSSLALRRYQIDLTENKLFTLSAGTRDILRNLDEPVRLRFFYSRAEATGFPALRVHADRVRALLETFSKEARGRLIIEEIEPAPYSEEEDLALAMGVAPLASSSGIPFYFGIGGTNAADGKELISYLDPKREQYLEYDLARLIQGLSAPGRPRLGILAGLPWPADLPALASRDSDSYLQINHALKESFAVDILSPQLTEIPPAVKVLLLLHPPALSDDALYAIDQFVMRGGRVLAFVDPLSERAFEQDENAAIANHTDGRNAVKPVSQLDKLFAAWGVQLISGKIVGDRERAMLVRAPADDDDSIRPLIDYVAWLELTGADFSENDLIMNGIDRLILASAGALLAVENASSLFTPLIFSSTDAMLIDAQKLASRPDPAALLNDFVPEEKRFVLGARISGRVKSAFPDGPPIKTANAVAEPAEQPGATGTQPVPSDKTPPADTSTSTHLAEPRGPANLIIVADSDLADERFWVRSFGNNPGQGSSTVSADNGKFVISAVENLLGSNALISLRARERADRPFVIVEKLRREAEARYLAQEQALNADIRQTELRLAELQGDGPLEGNSSAVLTDEQQQEIENFRRQLLQARRALREVQHNLNKDIVTLANRLRLINILLMPAVVVTMGLSFFGVGRYRRANAARRLERMLRRRQAEAAPHGLSAAEPGPPLPGAAAPTADAEEMAGAGQSFHASSQSAPMSPEEDGRFGAPVTAAQEQADDAFPFEGAAEAPSEKTGNLHPVRPAETEEESVSPSELLLNDRERSWLTPPEPEKLRREKDDGAERDI